MVLLRVAATQMAAQESKVATALREVVNRVNAACARSNRSADTVRLVAVSKTKPPELLKEAYDVGQRFFGENYVQELVGKAPLLPSDIQWHFIGHLQSNKVKQLLDGVPNLAVVETVDKEKLATKLDGAIAALGRAPLDVFVQVNTSGEESKSGVEPGEETLNLAKHIHTQCPHLRLRGLMTIGMPDYTSRAQDFECLARCRAEVVQCLGLPEDSLDLSMGMSGDFESAVEMGSTNIRVGSVIFGARDYSAKA